MTLIRTVLCMGRLLSLAVFTCILTVGCWDRVEIDQRAFVSAVGIDSPSSGVVQDTADDDQQSLSPRFRLSVEIPLLRVLQADGPPPITPTLEKPAFVLIGEGGTPYAVERELAARLSRSIFWGHTKAAAVGEEFAREIGFHPLMNFFTRDPAFDRRARMVVVDGKAADIIQAAVEPENLVGAYIARLMQTGLATSRAPNVGIQELEAAMYGRGNILLPRVALVNGELEVSGAAVVKHGKMIGWLSDIETLWALFVRDEISTTWIVVRDPQDAQEEIVYDLRHASTILSLRVHEGELICDIRITTEGQILDRLLHKADLGVIPLREVERFIAQAIEEGVRSLVRTLQQEFKVDVLGFGEQLSKRHPKLWESVRDGWDDVGFPAVKVTVHAETRIRRTGVLE